MAPKLLIYLFSIVFLIGITSAGTVSITGTCSSNLLPGNLLNFTVINTGNDTAYGAILSPFISGANPQNNSYPIGSLTPNIYFKTLIPLLEISEMGTYVNYFILTYQQGTSAFTALFPCLTNVGRPTTSGVYLTVNGSSNGGTTTINVSVFNGVRDNFTVNVSALFPPSFQFIGSKSYLVTLGPYQTKQVQFLMKYPAGQASYTGAIAEEYSAGNLSYSSFATVTILSSSQQSQTPLNWVLIGGGVLFAALVLLIIRSALKRKKPAENSS